MFEVWNKYIDLKARKTIVSNCILSPDAEFHHDKFELQRDTDDSQSSSLLLILISLQF